MSCNSVMPISSENIPPNIDSTRIYNSTSNISYTGREYIILKLLQQLCICFATVTFIWGVTNISEIELLSTALIGYYFYIILIVFLLPMVHVFMWFYILNKVGKFNKYAWHLFEKIICGLGVVACIACFYAPVSILLDTWSSLIASALLSTTIAIVLFSYNYYLASKSKEMKIPLQARETAVFTSNQT